MRGGNFVASKPSVVRREESSTEEHGVVKRPRFSRWMLSRRGRVNRTAILGVPVAVGNEAAARVSPSETAWIHKAPGFAAER